MVLRACAVTRSEPRRLSRSLSGSGQAPKARTSASAEAAGFRLGGRQRADRLERPPVVEPVDPFEGGVLDRLERALKISRRSVHRALQDAALSESLGPSPPLE